MLNKHISSAIAILDNMEREVNQARNNVYFALTSSPSPDDLRQLEMAFSMLSKADTFINQTGTELRQVKG